MEFLLELLLMLLQFVGEILLQIAFEAGAEFLGHVIRERRSAKPIHPVLAAVGCVLFGALAGWLSLLVFPSLFIKKGWMRMANLVTAPLAAGLAMSLFGSLRQRHEQELIRLDRFSYGFLFALCMAVVRFLWGR